MEVIRDAFRRHVELATALAGDETFVKKAASAAALLAETLKTGRTVYVCGNGGSAADAQHLAAEWLCKYKNDRTPLPAIALTVNTSAITAIGNDYGFEYIFSRQIDALGKSGDVLIALSTSGSSPNVLQAVKVARTKDMKVVALTGKNGLKDSDKNDIVIAVPSSETARIQEMHELIYHAWCESIDEGVQS